MNWRYREELPNCPKLWLLPPKPENPDCLTAAVAGSFTGFLSCYAAAKVASVLVLLHNRVPSTNSLLLLFSLLSMAQTITLRVLQGADRGRVFHNLITPITIGREEGNIVQLNDERISRFHVKIQEDDGRLVVTDLESTNGTRVNGQVCNLKILRNGDTISVGRTVLLVGNRSLSGAVGGDLEFDGDDEGTSTRLPPEGSSSQRALPTLPRGLSPGQAAELREVLDHIHIGLRGLVENGIVSEKEKRVEIEQRSWAKLLTVQSDISEWIRAIEDPQASQSGSRG